MGKRLAQIYCVPLMHAYILFQIASFVLYQYPKKYKNRNKTTFLSRMLKVIFDLSWTIQSAFLMFPKFRISSECPDGFYGYTCYEMCNLNCGDPGQCNTLSGECKGGCQPGWRNLKCDASKGHRDWLFVWWFTSSRVIYLRALNLNRW